MRYVWQKIGGVLSTVLAVSALTFLIVQVLPGDPALLMLGTEGSPEAYVRLRAELNLDQAVWQRYFKWSFDFLRGQWGNSWRYSLPVGGLVWRAFPLTLSMALLAVSLALVMAIPTGMVMAVRPDWLFSRLVSVGSHIGMALPQFWIGLLLIQIFAVKWRLLPSGGSSTAASLVLPIVTLALPRAAVLSRVVRVGLNEALQQDYVRTARAKGLPGPIVLFKHALRNGILGVMTIAGLQLAQLFAGSIVVEQVFGLPGLGQLLLAGVLQRDIPLVQALVMVVVLMILGFDLLFDLSLGFLDPRLRYE